MCNPLSDNEILGSINMTSNGKAPGSDKIPAQVFKHGGLLLFRRLMTSGRAMQKV